MINFDNAATTPVLEVAKKAFLEAPQGNPSSSHSFGREAKAALENCRNEILSLLGCGKEYNLYFTSGATEACNWAVKSICSTSGQRHRSLVASPFEHHAITEAVEQYNIPKYAKLDHAQMLVNNETGQLYDVKSLCGKDGLVACDMTAAIGHTSVNIGEISPDYVMFGGHKFGAPKGIGALIVREGCPIAPMIYGGAQERGMRGGTVSVPLANAMAAALAWRVKHMADSAENILRVRIQLIFDLVQFGVDHIVNFNDGHRQLADHILSVRFPGVYGATLAAALSENGVMVSTGSACSSGDNAPSANLTSSGLTEQEALETIRFSFDYYNTPQEAAEAARIIARLAPSLRRG